MRRLTRASAGPALGEPRPRAPGLPSQDLELDQRAVGLVDPFARVTLFYANAWAALALGLGLVVQCFGQLHLTIGERGRLFISQRSAGRELPGYEDIFGEDV